MVYFMYHCKHLYEFTYAFVYLLGVLEFVSICKRGRRKRVCIEGERVRATERKGRMKR